MVCPTIPSVYTPANTSGDFADIDWHLIDLPTLYTRLATSPTHGLATSQITASRTLHGRNIPSKPPSQLPRKLFSYFFGGFGSILFLGAILVFIAWKPLGKPNPAIANLALAIVLTAVWIIQAVFNGYQDFSSSRVMNSITGMLPEECVVVREGEKRVVGAAEVVPGDVLVWKAGGKLPADVRFVECSRDARFDRGILTGESVPVPAVVRSEEKNYLESRCVGLQGTCCVGGSGVGVVVVSLPAE